MNHEKHSEGMVKSRVSTYFIGFGLSLILTSIPFAVVMTAAMSYSRLVAVIVIFGIAQVVVHFIFFLHMKPSAKQSWNGLAFIYTFLLLCILVGASIWIMYHLNHNMMVH